MGPEAAGDIILVSVALPTPIARRKRGAIKQPLRSRPAMRGKSGVAQSVLEEPSSTCAIGPKHKSSEWLELDPILLRMMVVINTLYSETVYGPWRN